MQVSEKSIVLQWIADYSSDGEILKLRCTLRLEIKAKITELLSLGCHRLHSSGRFLKSSVPLRCFIYIPVSHPIFQM